MCGVALALASRCIILCQPVCYKCWHLLTLCNVAWGMAVADDDVIT